MNRRGPSTWAVATAVAIACGVAFSVLLMSVAQGVSGQLHGDLATAPARSGINVPRIDQVLTLLTIVITAAMLLQTGIATFTMGVTTMRGRREEIALRRQSGVLRSRLLREFAGRLLTVSLIGGITGEVVGIAAGEALATWTVLPVTFTPITVFAAFPITVLLALLATVGPAWQSASASPALLRRGG
jgi:ABC-type antimicrobial peptide transport system permease subunit